MTAALNNLDALSAAKKAAIIGDMFELGEEAPEQHQRVIELAMSCNIQTKIFIGSDFSAFKNEFDGLFFETRDEAATYLTENPIKDQLVLLKGSRGMALERLLPLL